MKTRALVFPEANKFQTAELTLPDPGPGDMVVKTLVSAISPGTERWTLRGLHIGTRFPCVPGYHRIGIVEACGPEVSAFKPGDVVYGSGGSWAEPIVSMWGAHVGHSVSPPAGYQLVDSSIPPRAELESLSFAVVAGVGHRGIRFLDVQAAEKVLIIGSGFIGICAAQFAACRGAEPFLVEKDPARIEFVRGLGLRALDVSAADLGEQLTGLAPGGFDTLYDTVGHAATTDRLVQYIRRQGKMLLQAQYFDKERCALDLDQIKVRELTIKTTCGVDLDDRTETMRHIREGRLDIESMITHRFDSADILQGYELLHTGTPLNMGIVFFWDDRVGC